MDKLVVRVVVINAEVGGRSSQVALLEDVEAAVVVLESPDSNIKLPFMNEERLFNILLNDEAVVLHLELLLCLLHAISLCCLLGILYYFIIRRLLLLAAVVGHQVLVFFVVELGGVLDLLFLDHIQLGLQGILVFLNVLLRAVLRYLKGSTQAIVVLLLFWRRVIASIY